MRSCTSAVVRPDSGGASGAVMAPEGTGSPRQTSIIETPALFTGDDTVPRSVDIEVVRVISRIGLPQEGHRRLGAHHVCFVETRYVSVVGVERIGDRRGASEIGQRHERR